jgi:DNA-binding SARP family transcriptional activator
VTAALGPRLSWTVPAALAIVDGQPPARRLSINALGPVEVRLNGKPVPLTSHRALDLLLYLLLHQGGVTREQIIARLWPDLAATGQHSQFHCALIRLRRGLYPEIVQHRDGLYFVDPELVVEWDVDRFEEIARLIIGSESLTPTVAAAGKQLFEVYRGEFLGRLVGDWYVARQATLHDRMVQAARHLARLYRESGAHPDALATLRQAVAFAPFSEPLQIDLIRALVALDRQAEARRHWRTVITRFREDLGIEPTPAFLALERELLAESSNRSRRKLATRARIHLTRRS